MEGSSNVIPTPPPPPPRPVPPRVPHSTNSSKSSLNLPAPVEPQRTSLTVPELKAPAAAPTSTPQPTHAPTTTDAGLIIRTMRDDLPISQPTPRLRLTSQPTPRLRLTSQPTPRLRGTGRLMNQPTNPPSKPPASVSVPALVPRPPQTSRSAGNVSINVPAKQTIPEKNGLGVYPVPSQPPKIFPLPPVSNAQPARIVLAPTRSPLRRRRALKASLAIFIFLVLAGGASAAAWWWTGNSSLFSNSSEVTVGFPGIVATEAEVVIRYDVGTPENKTAIQALWNDERPLSLERFLAGDPRLALNDPAVTDVAYVLLGEETTPFVLVPITTGTTTLLKARTAPQVAQHNGWFIVHSTSAEPYLEALARGTVADSDSNDSVTAVTTGAAIRLKVGSSTINRLVRGSLRPTVADSTLANISLAGQTTNDANLILTGQATTRSEAATGQTPPSTTSGQANQQLFSAIPSSATWIRLGATIDEDITAWGASGNLDASLLRLPSVQALLTQAAGPYALIGHASAASPQSLGLVIALKETETSAVADSSVAIEQALQSAASLLTGAPAGGVLTFSQVDYKGVPVHYTNLSAGQALDYALVQNYLVVATSKDAMFALLDTIAGRSLSIMTEGSWQHLITSWPAIPVAHDLLMSTLDGELAGLLAPWAGGDVLFGLALQTGSVQGVLVPAATTFVPQK